MEKSDLILRAWDTSKNSADVKILDLWQAVDLSIETQKPQNSTAFIQNKTSVDTKNAPDLLTIIKEWGGYSSKSISDSELLDYLKINAKHIPSWFMKTSKWIVNNDITEQEFVNAITYMHEHGVVK
jgi:hypothetical protein